MTKDEFIALSKEMEGLEMSIAKGEDTEQGDARLKEIDTLLENAPWQHDMDTGEVVPAEVKEVAATDRMRG